MKIFKSLITVVIFMPLSLLADKIYLPHFKDYPVELSSGPFASTLKLTSKQQLFSKVWRDKIFSELNKGVNFAGHYRLYVSRGGEFKKECGDKGWVCGWVIDKISGMVVSELPEFNQNTAYFSIIDNGTPSPDLFYIEFYPNRTMIVIGGQNTPKKILGHFSYDDIKCAYSTYNYSERKFLILSSIGCKDDGE
ncbi:hypothetical protein [Cronobacter dublinensis]|uniref:hypothetical protein n=1 Tax=Cronobacter dublinensis TaxID=413497 RepID=UPI000CFE8826|nr:hypothetical protein [Cronobacter dublinensis]